MQLLGTLIGLLTPQALHFLDVVLRGAIDLGVTYLDVSPDYGDAEAKLKPALRGTRDRVFLVTKVNPSAADAAGAAAGALLLRYSAALTLGMAGAASSVCAIATYLELQSPSRITEGPRP